jgi:putative redox protein
MVLEALGTCPAVDVVTILAKMRESLKRLEITVDAERNNEPPRYIKSARVYFDLWGEDLNPEKVVRAIDLAFTKYCSVFHSLRDDLILLTAFRLHPVGAEAAGEYTPVELTPEVVG